MNQIAIIVATSSHSYLWRDTDRLNESSEAIGWQGSLARQSIAIFCTPYAGAELSSSLSLQKLVSKSGSTMLMIDKAKTYGVLRETELQYRRFFDGAGSNQRSRHHIDARATNHFEVKQHTDKLVGIEWFASRRSSLRLSLLFRNKK
jgi:hypothetical protein